MIRPLFTLAALSAFGLFVSSSVGEDASEPATQSSSQIEDDYEQTSRLLDQALGEDSDATDDSIEANEADKAKLAVYGAAYDFAWRIKPYYDDANWTIDLDTLIQGIKDGLADTPPRFDSEKIRVAVEELVLTAEKTRDERANAAAEEAEAKALASIANDAQFLEENKAKPAVTTTASGLQIEFLREGTGPTPLATDTVKVHYKGMFTNGDVFNDSYELGEPIDLAVADFIPGFSEGLMLTRVGGKSRLVIPFDLAYGERGRPPTIPPKAALVFEIELLEILKPANSQPDSNATDEPDMLPEDE